jgi:PAS domain S-box-containing protein
MDESVVREGPIKSAVKASPGFDADEPFGSIDPEPMDQRQLALAAMLVASSDDATVGGDTSNLITTWNLAAERLYGYKAEEVVGRNISFLIPSGRLGELEAVLDRVLRGAGTQHYDTSRIHKNGSLIDVSITVSSIKDPGGSIIGTSTIQQNITERKRTETVMAEMASIVDSSNDAIIGKSLEGVIMTWNRGAERIYGYKAEEMIGKSITLLVPPGHPDEVSQIIAGMLSNNSRTEHFETQRVRKDGGVIDVSVTVSPIRASDGTIVGASSVARDVTEHNKMVAALKSYQQPH